MKEKRLSRSLLMIMAVTSGIMVANIYYIQPLLGEISEYFGVSQGKAGIMATLTQIGYACGLFFILPFADISNRKKLVMCMMIGSLCSLIVFVLSHSYILCAVTSVAIGMTSIVPQLMIPFGAELSSEDERGKNIGTIMSGLLIGMLCSRVLSGFLGKAVGWKTVYIAAMGLVLVLGIVLYIKLPDIENSSDMRYIDSLRSLFRMPGKYPVLAHSAVNGAIIFAIFSAFWTVLSFHIDAEWGYGSDVAGMFGILGISGAVMAPVAGKMSDKKGSAFTVTFHLVIIAVTLVVFIVAGKTLPGLIVGTILLDYGVQCCNVANQSRIQALSNEERNRITSVYMVSFFLGGAAGSAFGTSIYERTGWYGFTAMASILILAALAFNIFQNKRAVSVKSC